MAIYEYRCNDCRRKIDVFARGFTPPADPTCTICGGANLDRVFSKFAMARSKNDKSVYDDILSDGKLTRGLMSNDPRALAEWSRKMARCFRGPTRSRSARGLHTRERGASQSDGCRRGRIGDRRGDKAARAAR